MSIDLANNEHTYPFIIGNVKIPFFYQPYYNPNKVTFTSKKAYNRTQTIGGNVFEAWGKDPVIMRVEMTVKKQDFLGGVIGVYKDLGVEDPLVCTEMMILQRLFEFDQRKLKESVFDKASDTIVTALGAVANPFAGAIDGLTFLKTGTSAKITTNKNSITDTIIYYKTNIYSGFFTDFYYEEDGRNPFINKVTFNFTITSSIADTLNNWLATSTTGRSIIGVLGAASAVTTATTLIDKVASGISSTVSNLGKL